MRRLLLVAFAPLLALIAAPAAQAARPVLIIRGAGFGHGVGMSQYGARGYALRGVGYKAILRHYYSGTRLGTVSPQRPVRVLLQPDAAVASFSGAQAAGPRKLDAHVTYQVIARGAQLELRNAAGRKLALLDAPLEVRAGQPVNLHGRALNGQSDHAYRGILELAPSGRGGVDTIDRLALDDYVAGVVGSEVSSHWPMAALEAQAVAARTYAITTSAGGAAFDQYPDTRSQVYGGVAAETTRTLAAVGATAGQAVTYRGQAVPTFFFSTSGGLTEDARWSFAGAAPRPWLRSVRDPYDSDSPRHRWTIRMAPATAGKRLTGLVKGGFRGIRVIRRGRSPRVVTAQIVGTRGDTTVAGSTLRARLRLPDTWAYFAVVG